MADEPTTISDNSEEPTSPFDEAQQELGSKWDTLRQAAGFVAKSRIVIPFTQAAIKFVIVGLGALGTPAAFIIGGVVALLALGAVFITYRQPERLLGVNAAHEPEPFNAESSVDRGNLLRVQSAAGLIPTLQRELIESRQLDGRIGSAREALKNANVPEDKRNEVLNLLTTMESAAKKVRETNDQNAQNTLLQELHTLGLRYEFLTAEIFLPGGSRRLKVPWRLQPVGSKTCNYYAAEMAVLYHAYERSPGAADKKTYPRGLEEKIMAGRTDPPKSCPANTEAYLRFAATQAGLGEARVETIHFSGSRSGKRGPSDDDWRKIRQIVTERKTPVVIGTKFSKGDSHFLTIVGFSEDGREVYVNDPGSLKARANRSPRDKNSPVHLIDDERWYGGTYPKASYLTFI